MKIKNETHYDTFYLRRLFLAAEKQMFRIYLQHTHPKHRRVRVMYSRSGRISGCAWLNSCALTMRLPKHKIPKAQTVAQIYIHEVGHNLGLQHKRMVHSSHLDVSWWPDEFVSLKAVKVKPIRNIIEERAKHVQKKLEEWQRKQKRAKTFVKKYQQKVRYYEKKMAANK